MILPKVRDPRFVTIRRGGTLTDPDHRLLALWAASCAERVLGLFESAQPEDPRPLGGAARHAAYADGQAGAVVHVAAHELGAAADAIKAARAAAPEGGGEAAGRACWPPDSLPTRADVAMPNADRRCTARSASYWSLRPGGGELIDDPQVAVQRHRLVHGRDGGAGLRAARCSAEDARRAGRRGGQAGRDAQQRGLACAVRSGRGGHLAGRDGQVAVA
jgi:hypothetical protein